MDAVGNLEGFMHDPIMIIAVHCYGISKVHERIDIHFADLNPKTGIFTSYHTGIKVYG